MSPLVKFARKNLAHSAQTITDAELLLRHVSVAMVLICHDLGLSPDEFIAKAAGAIHKSGEIDALRQFIEVDEQPHDGSIDLPSIDELTQEADRAFPTYDGEPPEARSVIRGVYWAGAMRKGRA